MTDRWAQIPKFEGFYDASPEGLIRNARTGRILSPFINQGYYSIGLRNKSGRITTQVHLVILTTFVGERPSGMVGAHLNGCAKDNRLENLAWVTPAENEAHKKVHGTFQAGTKSCKAKFSDIQIVCIREAHQLGLPLAKIAVIAGVHTSTVRDIVQYKSYALEGAAKPDSATLEEGTPSPASSTSRAGEG